MVSQPENRLDFGQIMDTGKIFLAKLPQGLMGTEDSYLFGTLLVSKFQQLAMSRQAQQMSLRRDFWLYIEEFDNFITPSMAEILKGARKYRLGLTLAHHELHQLERNADVGSAVMSHPAMAQWEREEIVDRVKASVSIRAKLGHPLGGPASFGYCWKDKKLVPHPKEAPVRKLMYDLFLEHRRKKTVVRLLNAAGHRTRKGALFTSKTVTRLLQDPTAKGSHRANYTTRDSNTKRCSTKPEDQWATTEVEPIVTSEIWEQCNQMINQSHQAQRRPAKKPVHVFAGIAHCECGERMYVPSNSPKYVCGKCRNKIAIVDLEGIFCDELQGYSFSADKIKAYLEKADETLVEKQRLLELQRSQLQKTDRKSDRVYKQI